MIVQVNYTSYFCHFQICGQCLYYRMSRTVIYRHIEFQLLDIFLATFFGQ